MSFLRAKSRAINKNVYYDNRTYGFLKLPIRTGNLYVEKNETVRRDLDVGGNLTIGGDLSAKNVRANKGNFYLDNYLLVPYGTIIQSAAVTVPDGWLLCDGASILKATYPNLFNAIGYVYGGSALYFNVPDMRGRVTVGSGDGAGTEMTSRVLADTGGAETHTLSVDEMPSHTHSSNAVGGTYGLLTANGSGTAINGDNSGGEPNIFAAPVALVIDENGLGDPHNNMQPFLVLNYLIKY